MRNVVLGFAALVSLLTLLGVLLWLRPGEPDLGTVTPDSAAGRPDGLGGQITAAEGEAPGADEAQSDDTIRQPIMPTPGPVTSLLLRVIERESGAPVPGFAATLIPDGAATFDLTIVDGVSDARGEILWEDISWQGARIYPPLTEELITLRKGQRNERAHEVEFAFTVQGTVVDTQGQPVPGAEIWTCLQYVGQLGASEAAVTDAHGAFSFPVRGTDRLYAFARLEGRAPSRLAEVLKPKEGLSVQLRLGIGDESGTLVGKVVASNGTPLLDARVLVRGSNVFLPKQDTHRISWAWLQDAPLSRSVRTDSTGGFRLKDLPIGKAAVTVTATGWPRSFAQVDIVPGGTSSVTVTMNRGARILGTIRDSDGQPVESVSIVGRFRESAARTATTDREGHYALELVEPGRVELDASHPLRGKVRSHVEIDEGDELRWEPVFGGTARIRGVVLDRTGEPVPEVRLLLSGTDGEDRHAETDSEGRFEVPHTKEQMYMVWAYPPGFSTLGLGNVRPGESELTLRLPELPTVDAYVVGRVVDQNGEPVSPVNLWGFSNTELSPEIVSQDLTASDGRFRMGPMPSGSWTFYFETKPYPRVQETVILGAGETTDLGDITLEEPIPLEVFVHLPSGYEGRVTALFPGFRDDHGDILQPVEGHLIIPPVGAGSYTLAVFGEDLVPVFRKIDLVRGYPQRLEVHLQPGVPRKVTATLPEGTESSRLRLKTFDSSGRELVSLPWDWESFREDITYVLPTNSVRLQVTTEDGLTAEANLGPEEEIRLVLR